MAGWSHAQAQKVWQLKQAGLNFEQISLAIGVRPTIAENLVSYWEAYLSEQAVWHHGLPVRIANKLKINGIDSLENLQSVWAEGDIQKGFYQGIGPATIDKIRAWLESSDEQTECSETLIPVIVYLSPTTLKALDALAISVNEDHSEIIKRLIQEADEQQER